MNKKRIKIQKLVDIYDENSVTMVFDDGFVSIINTTDEEILGTIQISV